MSIDITIHIPDEDIWASICGSAWESWSWWHYLDYDGGDWDKPCNLWVVVSDPWETDPDIDDFLGDSTITAVITLADIKRAINELSGHPYVMRAVMNHFDFDAVYGDAVMQQAVFGEIVYG